jgi:prepilin-type N-terminal cleavage/methylation domain-containing protein
MFFVSKLRLRSRNGFTIIELLVAIGVTAILVTLMLTITLNVLAAWNRSSGKLTTNATARLVLDQLSQDISSLIVKRDGNVWLAATVQRNPTGAGDAATTDADWSTSQKPVGTAAAGSLDVDQQLISDMRFGKAGVWLRYFVAQPDSNDGTPQNASAPRACAFQIIRRNLGTAASPQYSYQLFRSDVIPYSNSSPTAQQRSTFGMGFDLFTTALNGYNHTTTGTINHASNIRNPNVTQLIGNDVVDFGVRFYERTVAGNLVEVFPVNRRDALAAPVSAPFTYVVSSDIGKALTAANAPTGPQTFGFPVEAEIMIRVLSPEGVRQIQAFEENSSLFPGQIWWDIVTKNSDVYTRRVEIKALAL